MKTRHTIISLFFMLFLISNGIVLAGPDEAETGPVQVYEVFGMDCPACHGGIEKLVRKIPSVKEARANWVEKTLHVTLRPDQTLSREVLKEAVEKANFTLGERIE